MTYWWIFLALTTFVFVPNFLYLVYKARQHQLIIMQEKAKWVVKKEYTNEPIRKLVHFTLAILPIAFLLTLPVAAGYFVFVFGRDAYSLLRKRIKKSPVYSHQTIPSENGISRNTRMIDFTESFGVSRFTDSDMN